MLLTAVLLRYMNRMYGLVLKTPEGSQSPQQ